MPSARRAAAKETVTAWVASCTLVNLSYKVGDADLHALFGRIGEVETVTIVREPATGRARGFAFVEMRQEGDAQRASTELNDTEFEGRRLTVNEAGPKPVSGGGAGARFGSGSARRKERRW